MLKQIRWGPYSRHMEMTFCFAEGWQAQQHKLMTPGDILDVVMHNQNCLCAASGLLTWSLGA